MNDKILLIGQVYFDNDNDLKMYENNISIDKKFGYEIMIVDSSNYKSLFNYNLTDYYLNDKKNLVFNRKPFNYVNFFYRTDNVKLEISCENTAPHELNILYQNTKSFRLAKLLGYKYVLRVECDIPFNDFDINNIKNKINECVSNNKKSVFMNTDNYIGFHITFWDIDWYFDKIGDILNQNDWMNLLHKYKLEDNGIETIFHSILKDQEENYLKFDTITSASVKGYRYKETRRFYDSNVIIDFFKNDSNLYLASTNMDNDKFPDELSLTQHLNNGGLLINLIRDWGGGISWILIDPDINYVELNVDKKIFKLNKSELQSTNNVITFL